MKLIIKYEGLLMLLFAWGAFSSFIIAIFIKLGIDNRLIFGLKDAVIYLVALVVFARMLKNRFLVNFGIFLALFLVYVVLNYFMLNSEYVAPLNNIRQIVSPMAIILIFVYMLSKSTSEERLVKFVLFVHTIVFFFGITEYAVGFWKHFGLHSYFMLKGIPVDSAGLSYMFYEPMLNYRLRMTSTFIDPISAGHYFATMLSFVWFVPIYKGLCKRYLIITCFIGLLLCFSKGAFLQAFLMLLVFNSNVLMLGRISFGLLPFVVIPFVPNIRGVLIHVSGAYQSIATASIFGYGIGSVGNYAKMFSDNLSLYYELKISDTFLGALLGQIGIFGIAMWLAFMLRIVYLPHNLVPLKMMLSILVVSFLSENTLNVTSFVLPAFLISWAYSYYLRRPLEAFVPASYNEK